VIHESQLRATAGSLLAGWCSRWSTTGCGTDVSAGSTRLPLSDDRIGPQPIRTLG